MVSRWTTVAVLSLLGAAFAQDPVADPFPREGKPEQRKVKDPLEGKAPPALVVDGWRNTDRPLVLSELRGKVVLLDFWGEW